MKYYDLYEVLFPVCYVAVGLFLLCTGVYGLLKQKPAIYPAWRGMAAFVLFLLPLFFTCFNLVFVGPRNGGADINDAGLVLIPLFVVFFWWRFPGLHVIGMTKKGLGDVLGEETHSIRRIFGLGLSLSPQGEASKLSDEDLEKLRKTPVDYPLVFVVHIAVGFVVTFAGVMVRIFS